MKKGDVLEVIQAMPDDIDIDGLVYRLQLRQKLDAAERAFREGRVLTHDELVLWSRTWFR